MLNEKINKYFKLLKKIKEIENQANEIKDEIKNEMIAQNTTTIETKKLKITYVPESTSVTLDTKRLKAEHPELADIYGKSTIRQSYIKVTEKNAA